MRLGEHEGVVVYDPSNMFYLSGYTGEGLVLVARGISAIVTDFRYTEQAQSQAPGFEVLMTEKGKSHEDIAGALCASGGIDTLYYEDDFVTVHTFNALRESVRGVEWKVVGSEIARLRGDSSRAAQSRGLAARIRWRRGARTPIPRHLQTQALIFGKAFVTLLRRCRIHVAAQGVGEPIDHGGFGRALGVGARSLRAVEGPQRARFITSM